jgi:hypothetical protein
MEIEMEKLVLPYWERGKKLHAVVRILVPL